MKTWSQQPQMSIITCGVGHGVRNFQYEQWKFLAVPLLLHRYYVSLLPNYFLNVHQGEGQMMGLIRSYKS